MDELLLRSRSHNTWRVPISEHTIWLIALGLIALDLLLFVVPIVPFVVAYVLVARPPWFKAFVDTLYDAE